MGETHSCMVKWNHVWELDKRLAADLDFTNGVSEVYVILDDEVCIKTLC